MRLFSYVVARDYGFAPNPFFGYCTLATCKPQIRRLAKPGDWVVGSGTAANNRAGYLVFWMTVEETLTFDEYWSDARFAHKKPNIRGSKKQAFGDNIYYRSSAGKAWRQLDSHHSFSTGKPNPSNIENDTQTNRVLIATKFSYWGGMGPKIPQRFRNWAGVDICAKRAHRSNFPDDMKTDFIKWLTDREGTGYIGEPLDWKNSA